ncbi:MAG: hypothetical protein IKU24_04010 [Clostridia bacterium]|nr:hypothetical protein [Clostridia bacterium]
MEIMPIIKRHLSLLDHLVLLPTITLGLSCLNQKTGEISPRKSVSFKTGVTIRQIFIFLSTAFFALYTLRCLMRIKQRRKFIRKMKKRRGNFWKK